MSELGDLRQHLHAWIGAYIASAGASAQVCAEVTEGLLAGRLNAKAPLREALALLDVLAGLSPDPRTVCCALLYVAHVHGENLDDWKGRLPTGVPAQLASLLQLHQVKAENFPEGAHRSAEGLRRLLLALVKDVRVVLIALAWQLVQLRAAKDAPGQAAELARETLLIHAPLANRLGVWQLKWELEDLAFRFQEPDAYRRVAKQVAERRADREVFIRDFIHRLEQALKDAGIRGQVLGRPKHIYSIWKKMQSKGLDVHELFDLRAVRVLVDDVPACYSVLGLVHGTWQPIPGEFDDYITTPKGNNYQSLHTAVVGPEGKAVEVQIRTFEMNEHAELGVAAHWRYKEGGPNDPAFDRKVAVMRQLLDGADEGLDDESLLESFQSATSEDRVYALTPKGQVIDLALGATVLDFAYHVHTEVGHRCRGAKVNGRIVPLTHAVATGDRVEILTGKESRPSRDWLNPRLGYIHGARARAKVRQWYKRESHDEHLREGRELVEAELKRMGLGTADLDGVPAKFQYRSLDDLFAAVGSGDLAVAQVASAAERLRADRERPEPETLVRVTPKAVQQPPTKRSGDLTIEGVGNLMTSMARCCQPLPGDPVVGYITRGRGVTIHREDCRNVLRWQGEESPRLLQVRWGARPEARYRAGVLIRAINRRELFKDISQALASAEVSVTDMNSRPLDVGEETEIRLALQLRTYEQLSELMTRLSAIRNVLDVSRLRDELPRKGS